MKDLASKLIAYMKSRGDVVFEKDGALNIVYLEGANIDGTENADKPDGWNDVRYLVRHFNGYPEMLFAQIATTEPGVAPTHSAAARKRGGIGRIILGQQKGWKMGFHKGDVNHPALVQCAELLVHRDVNEDYRRTGDPIKRVSGLNQHGTRIGYDGDNVGNWSEACLVGRIFNRHLEFIAHVKNSPEYQTDENHVFHTAVYGADDFNAWIKKNYPANAI
ncbi:MAG: hypothetical protein EB059_10550 [Alphaproteobacteria bacterium]|nr:hypothetical protein [Alphaproteobacteria bacterium]